MGCCQSRERSTSPSPNQESPQNASSLPRDTSRTPINQPHRPISNVSSPAIPQPSITAQWPNRPIRPPTPVEKSPPKVSNRIPPWTRKHLEKERDAFFETRVSGNDEVWSALRVVCGMVRGGELGEAQGILDALNLTCPTGRIARDRGKHKEKGGVFDERGVLYDLPAWVVTDPLDIVDDDDEEEEKDADAVDDEEEKDGAAGTIRKDEKGKGRAEDPGETCVLRARLSSTGADVTITVGKKEKIGDVVRRIQQEIGSKRVRLMYLGKALEERSTLEQSAWKEGQVINALVFEGKEEMLSKSAS